MAVQTALTLVSFKAGEDLSNYRYHFVMMGTIAGGQEANEVMMGTANAVTVGILQNAPEEGKEALVAITGISKLVYNETITMGARLTSTAAGHGEVVDAAGEFTGAIALEAGVLNDIRKVLITHFTSHAA